MGAVSDGLFPIALVGLPGAGCSTVGALLANRLGVPFHDLDELAELGLASGVFTSDTAQLTALASCTNYNRPSILAVPASVVANDDARSRLRRRAVTFWLQAPTAVLAERTAQRWDGDMAVASAVIAQQASELGQLLDLTCRLNRRIWAVCSPELVADQLVEMLRLETVG